MKNSFLTFIVFAFASISVNAQTSSTDFFFGYKKSSLTSTHTATLDQLLLENESNGSTIKVISHCDSVGGVSYNIGLGQRRIDLFVNYLTSKGVSADRISEVNNGSRNPVASNATEEGRELNRKVIVQFFGGSNDAPQEVEAPEPEPQGNEIEDFMKAVAAINCGTDTIVNLTGGAKLKMNACEFSKYNSCLVVNILTTPAKLRNTMYTTMGMSGQIMSTSGIVEVEICEDKELEHSLTVYVPVKINCKPEVAPDLWTNFGKGVWNARVAKAQIETIGDKDFYVFTTTKNNEANFASRINETPEFKIKAKKGLKIKEVTAYYSCEIGIYRKTLDKPSKKMKIKLPCASNEVKFDVIAEDKKGNKVVLKNLSSLDIKSKGKQKSCEAEGVKKCFYVYPN